MDINVYLSTLRQKGNLAYEYNPFHNYQTDVDLYKVSTNVGDVLVPKGYAVNSKNGEILTKKGNNNWIDKRGNRISSYDTTLAESGTLIARAGSLVDLDTDQLNFDLEHEKKILTKQQIELEKMILMYIIQTHLIKILLCIFSLIIIL